MTKPDSGPLKEKETAQNNDQNCQESSSGKIKHKVKNVSDKMTETDEKDKISKGLSKNKNDPLDIFGFWTPSEKTSDK